MNFHEFFNQFKLFLLKEKSTTSKPTRFEKLVKVCQRFGKFEFIVSDLVVGSGDQDQVKTKWLKVGP